MDDTRESFLSRLHHYRQEDRHECALINARMMWLINIQGALVISFFVVSLHKDPFLTFYSSVILYIAAVFFAQILSRAVRAAELMIQEWQKKEFSLYKELKEMKNNDLIKELESYFSFKSWEADDEKEWKKKSDAFSFQRIVFPGLMVFWFFLIACSAYNFMEHEMKDVPKGESVSYNK